ncbi:MAG: hypothetical protein OXF31_00710 [Gammaproteobacteria bacterium]|nr:hypothetical protein [Gammaproteobacteria bacterium]
MQHALWIPTSLVLDALAFDLAPPQETIDVDWEWLGHNSLAALACPAMR